MAHELTMNRGKAEMAYVGDVPWHGLGQELQRGASIETWREQAGMAWEIKRTPVEYKIPMNGATVRAKFPARDVLYRSDNGVGLGIVSDDYRIVQPGDVLEFFRSLVEAEGFELETAGTLFDGRRFWALANIGDDAIIADRNDKMKGYLLLSTSADGSLSTEARYTSIRVVCNNTLRFSLNKSAPNVRVTHRGVFDASTVKGKLGIGAHEGFASFINDMRRLAETPLNWQDAVKVTLALFEGDKAERMTQQETKEALEKRAPSMIGDMFVRGTAVGSEMAGTKGTAYGWLNCVTQYVDHMARAKSSATRLNSAWFGEGEKLKTKAYELVNAL